MAKKVIRFHKSWGATICDMCGAKVKYVTTHAHWHISNNQYINDMPGTYRGFRDVGRNGAYTVDTDWVTTSAGPR